MPPRLATRALCAALTLTTALALALVSSEAGAVTPDASPVVIALNDQGINPYHDEFSVDTYADAAILDLTDNFTRHPSEYLPGYPADAKALHLTLSDGWWPDADRDIFTPENITPGQMYWIPGTKIVGVMVSAGRSQDGDIPILDGHDTPSGAAGHGTGVASTAAGNSTGSCPSCLIVAVERGEGFEAAVMPFVDLHSNSYMTAAEGPEADASRAAAQTGQVTLFGAGNGLTWNFLVPYLDAHLAQGQGPSWNLRVGGIDRASGRPTSGDGVNAEVSSYMNDIPAATSNSVDAYYEFGGTSGATPLVAGVMGSVLGEVRALLGDTMAGPKGGGRLAVGTSVPGSPLLADGVLTRAELLAVVIRSASTRVTDNTAWRPGTPPTAPHHESTAVLFEGYGTVDVDTIAPALAVLRGEEPMPARAREDEFFRTDHAIRDELWGPCGCDTWLESADDSGHQQARTR